MKLVSLYLEAKAEWKKPISSEFYDFFAKFCSNRVSFMGKNRTEAYYEDYYQLNHAKRRFIVPTELPEPEAPESELSSP